jgi:hypothetical protein
VKVTISDDQTKLNKWLSGGLNKISPSIEDGAKVTKDLAGAVARRQWFRREEEEKL